ncbi:MAG: imidazole glycerol phosphate synthase subunit HisH [Candidatus Spyradenecus sp.]
MVTILDYGAGNLTSVCLAFERLGEQPRVIIDAAQFTGGRLVFPGVGSAGSGIAGVRTRGFDTLLAQQVKRGVPVLGICLGMQLLLDTSAEDGGTAGLGLIPGACVGFDPAKDPEAKIPHMGWNTLDHVEHPLFANIAQGEAFYFVHSYFAKPACEADILGRTEYCGERFAAVIGRGSLVATQFHPERSGRAGEQLLRNFLAWEA